MPSISPRLKSIIDANVPAHLRYYMYNMVAKEGASGKDSPTGARGPLQFTRGTGAKYGLVKGGKDLRGNEEANIRAGVGLTLDNAAILRRHLGRDPSLSELALAHQQGPETAGLMLTGKGNAPAKNLAVNNIDPNTPPQEAARKIMNYYGFNKQGPQGVTLAGGTVFNDPASFAAPAEGSTAVPYINPYVAAGSGGLTLASNPTGVPIAGTEAPAAPASFAERALGTDLQGGKGTPFAGLLEGLETANKGLNPQATDPKLNEILPTSGAAVDQRIASQQPLAQNMLSQMIQGIMARRR